MTLICLADDCEAMIKAITTIKKAGCRAVWRDDRLFIDLIPNWRTFLLVREYSDELGTIGLVRAVMGQDPMPPIRYQEGDCKCAFCTHLSSGTCLLDAGRKRIPSGQFREGCKRWNENQHIYF